MKLVPWGQLDDDERKIASAQMLVLLVCVSPLLGLVGALVGMLFGNRAFATVYAANPRGVWLGIGWVLLYVLAGVLIGARRAIGGMLGLALFAWSLWESWRQGRLLTFNAAFAVLGIVVIARAGGVLGFPFWPGKPVVPAEQAPRSTVDTDRTD